jgi:hypothetical protein
MSIVELGLGVTSGALPLETGTTLVPGIVNKSHLTTGSTYFSRRGMLLRL